MGEQPTVLSFANRLLNLLQEVDYRIAERPVDKENIFKLRHTAYLEEGAIDAQTSGMFMDAYDEMDNCWIFGVFLEDQLLASIRFHVISPSVPRGPAMDVFPDLVRPMLDEGHTLIDPTRFVADRELSEDYPEIPYMTLRVACMAYEYFDAQYCLATVRREHQAFYRRVFRATPMCDPRPYPTLKAPIALMRTNVSEFRNYLQNRYPIFNSSLTERRMLFEARELGRTDAFPSIGLRPTG